MKKLLILALSLLLLSACTHMDGMDAAKKYTELVQEQDPGAALKELANDLEADPELANTCHMMVHAIGNSAFDRYGFVEAMTYASDLCGSGYMHGATEKYIAAQDDPEAVLKNVCPADYGACFHGVGHGLMMFHNGDVSEALKNCSEFPEQKEQVQCSEGVFMELFSSDTNVHKNKRLDPENPMGLCQDQSDLYKSACYFYVPRYFLKMKPDAYSELMNTCSILSDGFDQQCARGAGSAVMKTNLSRIPFVIQTCESAPENLKNACFSGLTSYYVIHIGSLERAKNLCPQLPLEHQKTCESTVANSEDFFIQD
jgi:hypothetical protein